MKNTGEAPPMENQETDERSRNGGTASPSEGRVFATADMDRWEEKHYRSGTYEGNPTDSENPPDNTTLEDTRPTQGDFVKTMSEKLAEERRQLSEIAGKQQRGEPLTPEEQELLIR